MLETKFSKQKAFPEASKVGFGCASLGSRVEAKRGLKSIAKAYERGVNWFDLAPSYGDGTAEEIFSQFLKKRRDKLYICTKVGISAPKLNPVLRSIKPVARKILRIAPGMRGAIAQSRRPSEIVLDASSIRSSLENSLRKLDTDYLDVFALHDPGCAILENDDAMRTLSDLKTEGKVRCIGIAGSREVASKSKELSETVDHIQYAIDLKNLEPPRGTEAFPSHAVHSVLTKSHDLSKMIERSHRHEEARRIIDMAGYDAANNAWAGELMLDFFLTRPWIDTILLSMFSPVNQERNLARLEKVDNPVTNPEVTISQLLDLLKSNP